jgi:glutamate 5-kinase
MPLLQPTWALTQMSHPTTSNFKHTFKTDTTPSQQSTNSNTIVLKIGSSSITGPDGRILVSNLGRFVEFTYFLRQRGYKVVIVSSGAVSVGVNKLNLTERPKDLVMKQAVAAIGQNALMVLYDNLFSTLGITTGQILLTRDNINNEYHYLNATNTMEKLLDLGIVPIINENDTISMSELKIGDNDSLAAMVSCMLNAKHLFLATDVSCLYTADPKTDPTAKPLHYIENVSDLLRKFSTKSTSTTPQTPLNSPSPSTTCVDDINQDHSGSGSGSDDDNKPLANTPSNNNSSSGSGSGTVATKPGQPAQSGKWGTGGIYTKIIAGNLCSACGVDSSIIDSGELHNIIPILEGDYSVGTTFKGQYPPLSGRKKFLWVGILPVGNVYIDQQCAKLFTSDTTRSYHLLPAGILFSFADINGAKLYFDGNVAKKNKEEITQKDGKIKEKVNFPAGVCVNIIVADEQYLKNVFGKHYTSQTDLSDKITNNNADESSNNLPNGLIIGRGIVNYGSEDINKIRGANTKNVEAILQDGSNNSDANCAKSSFIGVIHSDNLAIHYRPSTVTNSTVAGK